MYPDNNPSCCKQHHLYPSQSIILYILSFVTVSVVSGCVYGWPALRRNLVNDHDSTLSENELGIIFTVGAWSTQGGRWLFGIARDTYTGTKVTATISILLASLGFIGIAFSNENNLIGLATSVFFVGLGSGAQLCLQPVAGLFDTKYQGTILASLSGAFQVAGLVFLSLTSISDDRRITFGLFAIFLFILALIAFKLLPQGQFVKAQESKADGKEQEENYAETGNIETFVEQENSGKKKDKSRADFKPESDNQENQAVPTVQDLTAWDQLQSMEFILLIIWFSIQVIPLQYYLATIGFQLERKGDDDGTYTRIFLIIYSAVAIFTPFLGKIADTAGLGFGQFFATLLNTLSLIILALENVSLRTHVLGMFFYGLGRAMVYGMFFTNIGKRMGYKNYGSLAGSGLMISAIASLLQYPLIMLASGGKEKMVNIVSGTVMSVTALPYCVWLRWRELKEQL